MGTINKRYDATIVALPWSALPAVSREERCLAPISQRLQGITVSAVDTAERLRVRSSVDFAVVIGRAMGEPSVHAMKPETAATVAQGTTYGIPPRKGSVPPD
jgi:hypothetical protein